MNTFDVDSYEILFWIVVPDTVEVGEFNTCSDNGDNGTNHSVNLAISNVAWSCHSNKHKINHFLPGNLYTSLSDSAIFLNTY